MDIFPQVPEALDALSDEDLQAFIDESAEAVERVTADPVAHVTDDLSADELFEATTAAADALDAARAELEARHGDDQEAETTEPDAETEAEPEAEASVSDDLAAGFAQLGERVRETAETDLETDPEPETEPETEPSVTASTRPAALARPARSRRSTPAAETPRISLTAASPNLGYGVGDEIPSATALSSMMMKRRKQFGDIPAGTKEPIPIAMADWRGRYPEERTLQAAGGNVSDLELIERALDPRLMRKELDRRAEGSLTAAGGLCAPVSPYYGLMLLPGTQRPVRAALPAFNADRGGINAGRPASIDSIDIEGGIGVRTADDDASGGTFATKSCQVVDCPDFTETDVRIIYHCAQYGNLTARTFPELVTHWNALTMAGWARLAESELLTDIDVASKHVGAGSLGLGASATYPSQLLAVRAGMISRHRMDEDSVFRALIPFWVLDVLVSDVYRSQFDRFDMTKAQFVALLRANGIEPSFYIDSALGRSQVLAAQNSGQALVGFPATALSYVYPEGSFLFLDGGTLELGLVRDSVLNSTNDYQIFGESFEAAAFIGVESIALASQLCDSGAVSAPKTAPTCPISY